MAVVNGAALILSSVTGAVGAVAPAVVSGPQPAVATGLQPAVVTGLQPAVVSGPQPAVVSGNQPAVVSGPQAAVMSGPQPAVVSGPQPAVSGTSSSAVVSPQHAVVSPAAPRKFASFGFFLACLIMVWTFHLVAYDWARRMRDSFLCVYVFDSVLFTNYDFTRLNKIKPQVSVTILPLLD